MKRLIVGALALARSGRRRSRVALRGVAPLLPDLVIVTGATCFALGLFQLAGVAWTMLVVGILAILVGWLVS